MKLVLLEVGNLKELQIEPDCFEGLSELRRKMTKVLPIERPGLKMGILQRCTLQTH